MIERPVAILCAAPRSIYKQISGVEVYDRARDMRTFAGGMPVVAHPPCRVWSLFTRHQAKPEPGEAELGLLCADWLKREGGVLEQPAHSLLFEAGDLPGPGQRHGYLRTIAVWQCWWGYPMQKATWLCFSHLDLHSLVIPFRLHNPGFDRRRQQLMSKQQRSATCESLARWLVDAARRVSAATEGEEVPRET